MALSPITAWAIAHSAVSAAVTHGSSLTQRTPRPGMTKVLQRRGQAALALGAHEHVAQDRVVPVHGPAVLGLERRRAGCG